MIVIFDWDGTLCDSVDHIVRDMQAAARELGMAQPSHAAVSNIVGLGLQEAVRMLFPELPRSRWDGLADAYSRHYTAADAQPPQLFPGAMDTLLALR
mgnify:FL=1